MNNLEIERKFLVSGFPETESGDIRHVKQSYLVTGDKEVRVREACYLSRGNQVNHKLAIKTSGHLSRTEIEFEITPEIYSNIMMIIAGDPIDKEYRSYELEDGHKFEVSLVDGGTANEFYYAEVEFKSEEEACEFNEFLDEHRDELKIIKEVTDDLSYKMKNYWKRTRESSQN